MLRIFDYIFYSVRKAYLKWGENDVPSVYAVGVLSILQYLFIFSVTAIVYKFFHHDFLHLEKWHIILLGVILILFNFLRIYFIGINKIMQYWEEKTIGEKWKINLLTYFFIFLVIILTIFSIFFSVIDM